ncbi:MAG: purple acid phosphatase family protein [Candidatus Kapaibacteriota bacterium]
MRRRTFIAALIGILPFGKWIASIIASEVKNAPAEKPQITKMPSYEDETPLRFLALGDWGAGTALQKDVAASMDLYAMTKPIDMIISTGDNIYGKGVKSVDDPQWKTKFEDVYTGEFIQKPWYAIFGNHDYLGNVPAQIEYSKVNPLWSFPDFFYNFQMNAGEASIEFFMLDTNLLVEGNDINMLVWLEQSLEASTAFWKIVVGHHMIRSYGVYGDLKFMINKVKPILDHYKVDMYLSGHDHDLQLIKHPDDTFHQAISGAGGGSRDTSWGDYSLFSETNGGFAAITASSSSLYIEFINRHGELIYGHAIEKA